MHCEQCEERNALWQGNGTNLQQITLVTFAHSAVLVLIDVDK